MDGQDMGSAIQQIERLVKDANKTDVLDVKGERPGTYYLVGPDGAATKHVADPAWHHEKLASPGELRRFIEANKDQGSAVFYDETKVVFVRDLDDRRDVAICELKETPQFQWLKGQSGMMHSQAELVRVLRIIFRGCLPPDGGLLSLIRNLKFNATADGGANLQHARESLGRAITAQVTGEQAIPEETTLMIPVYENHPFLARVVCAIEVFPQEQKFKLTPYPMELRRANDDTLASIAELLTDDGLPPVFRGSPS